MQKRIAALERELSLTRNTTEVAEYQFDEIS